MRLQKYLAHAGVASRRTSETLITAGRVKVNGQVIIELGTKIDPLQDEVEVDNKLITSREHPEYYLFNKPKGVITTRHDPQGRRTVIDFLKTNTRVYPVGRLDYNSRGLLLLTNDGELAFRLTHPKYEIEKTYQVIVTGRVTDDKIKSINSGIKLHEGLAKPKQVNIISEQENTTKIEIVLTEGKKREVRRIFKKIGHPVIDLKRTEFCYLTLTGLSEGKYRTLSNNEVVLLKKLVGLNHS